MEFFDLLALIKFVQTLHRLNIVDIDTFGFDEPLKQAILDYELDMVKAIDFYREKTRLLKELSLTEETVVPKFASIIFRRHRSICLAVVTKQRDLDFVHSFRQYKAVVEKYRQKSKPEVNKHPGRHVLQVRHQDKRNDAYEAKIKLLGECLNMKPESHELHTIHLQQFRDNELPTIIQPVEGVASSKKSIRGYIYILKAYIGAHPELSHQDAQLIEDQIKIFEGLKVQAETCSNICARYVGHYDTHEYQIAVSQLVNDRLQELNEHGETFIRAGHSVVKQWDTAHAAYIKIYRDGDAYYRVDYNAGEEAIERSANQVWSVCVRRIHHPDQHTLAAMIHIAYEKRTRKHDEVEYLNFTVRESELPLGKPEQALSYSSTAQGKGNCSSRSLREILRHNLSDALFASTQDYILNRDVGNFKSDYQAYQQRQSTIKSVNVIDLISAFQVRDAKNWNHFNHKNQVFGVSMPLSKHKAMLISKLLYTQYGIDKKSIKLIPSKSQPHNVRITFVDEIQITDAKKFERLIEDLKDQSIMGLLQRHGEKQLFLALNKMRKAQIKAKQKPSPESSLHVSHAGKRCEVLSCHNEQVVLVSCDWERRLYTVKLASLEPSVQEQVLAYFQHNEGANYTPK